jgi:hypothetical protein
MLYLIGGLYYHSEAVDVGEVFRSCRGFRTGYREAVEATATVKALGASKDVEAVEAVYAVETVEDKEYKEYMYSEFRDLQVEEAVEAEVPVEASEASEAKKAVCVYTS